MTGQTSLFLIDADTPDPVIMEAAEISARRESHLSCLLIGPDPVLPMYAYGAPPYGSISVPDNWGEIVAGAQEAQSDRVDAIEALLAKSGSSGDVRSVLCATADIRRWVARSACVSDVAYLASNLRDAPDVFREAAYGVLFSLAYRLAGERCHLRNGREGLCRLEQRSGGRLRCACSVASPLSGERGGHRLHRPCDDATG